METSFLIFWLLVLMSKGVDKSMDVQSQLREFSCGAEWFPDAWMGSQQCALH